MSEKVFGTKKNGSIKDIPLPEKDASHTLDLAQSKSKNTKKRAKADDVSDWSHSKRKNKRMGYKIGIGIVMLILLLVGYSYLFHSATLTVEERNTNAVFAGEEFSAAVDEFETESDLGSETGGDFVGETVLTAFPST